MTGRTHVLIGASTAFAAAEVVHAGPAAAAALVGASAVASTLPDVDVITFFGHRLMRHRGVTHTLFMAVVATIWLGVCGGLAAGPAFAPAFAAGGFIGYGMHLVADRMTITGLPGRPCAHLLPRGYRFRTGGSAERLLAVLVIAATVLFAHSVLA